MTAHARTGRLVARARVWLLGVLSLALVAVWAAPAQAVSVTGAVAPGDVFVVDSSAGTACIPLGTSHGCGSLFRVDPATGQRTVVSDFGDPAQGPLGPHFPRSVAFDGGGLLVLEQGAGPACGGDGCGLLFRVDPATGQRTVLSDFGDPAQGPTGADFFDLTVDPLGRILVTDYNKLFVVDPTTGARQILSDFNDASQGPVGYGDTTGVAVEASGRILVTAAGHLTSGGEIPGVLFAVDPASGQRTVLSDFADPAQGPTDNPATYLVDVRPGAGGQLWVLDDVAGQNGDGRLFLVDETTGARTIVSDFTTSAQGPLGWNPWSADVTASGDVLIIDFDAGTNSDGALFRVDPTTGQRVYLSDFGDPAQGPLGLEPSGLVVAPGQPPPPPARSTLTVSKAGTGSGVVTSDPAGIDCGAVCSASYTQGFTVTLTATPDAGSRFTGWSGDADCADGVVTMSTDVQCTATFEANQPPTANAGGPYSVPEGGSITLSGSGTDPEGDALSFAWDLDGNGSFETAGKDVTFSAAGLDGPATVQVPLQVCDALGACAVASASVSVENVTPAVKAIVGTTVEVGTSFTTSGTFIDPGPDTWAATVDYGDGSGAQPLGLTGKTFDLAHTYATRGDYTVLVQVSDDDGGSGSASIQVAVRDTKPPSINCAAADGAWHADNVTIACTAADAGSGLVDPADASFSLATSVGAGSETANAATGTHIVCDQAGNCALAGPVAGNKVDRKAPAIDCGAADGAWHGADVTIACTSADAGSGLADPADASVKLATSVPAGNETANAATGTHQVCDAMGNCATAGPVAGNKVDRKAPAISLTAPASGAEYPTNSSAAAAYSCSDGGSGVASCSGPVASGQPFDTASVGAKSFAVQASDAVGNTATVTNPYTVSLDSDGDGLPDSWEKNGVTVNGQFLNLPAMGADPLHKDIFVETDYMADTTHSHQPDATAMQKIEQSFANAPVSNPDGTSGINLHVDYGPNAPTEVGAATTFGSMSRADALPEQAILGTLDAGGNYSWDAFDQIKNAHFDAVRRPVFHYAVFAHDLPFLPGFGYASGIARDIPASDFIVSLGRWTNGVGSVNQQAGTFMHELGHNLGLHHGGGDDINHKPNYLSVMNYSFTTRGLIEGGTQGHFDYSRQKLPDLNENSLNEAAGIGTNLGTIYYSGGSCASGAVVLDGSSVDWNCDGDAIDTGLAVDINNDPFFPGLTTLTGHDDWASLVFTGGAIGALGPQITLPSATPLDELTKEQDAQIPEVQPDTTPPTINCGSADGSWHASNVTIACTATDPSGLANPADASFTLSTTVADGQETANAQTPTRQVCDTKNNCATAGPIAGNKIDRKAPTLAPAVSPSPLYQNATGATVAANATDGGSGVDKSSVSCGSLDTSTVGDHTVTCSASDVAGNHNSSTVHYTVSYKFGGFASPLAKSTINAGSTLPAKFSLQQASGQPISDTEAVSLIGSPCKISVILVKPAGPVAGCPTYSTTLKQFQLNIKTTSQMKGANGVSITVTKGGAVVTTSPVDPFTVK